MRFIFCLLLSVFMYAEEIVDETNNAPNDEIKDYKEEIIDYEFPTYKDLDFANSMIRRFSLHNENYFIPVYYTLRGVRGHYKPYEVKLQVSAKINIFSNLFYGVGMFFGYTQVSFFQMYSGDISAPFRDNDYMPEVMLYRPIDWKLFGGEFYNIRFGYKHISNGEESFSLSRGVDRIAAELMYKNSGFRAHLKVWGYLGKDPQDIDKYMGYSDLTLSYNFLNRNHLTLNIFNLVHNYKKYKGGFLFEYKFDLDKLSLYFQYFNGYGDNIFQYNIKTRSIGIGFSVRNNIF